MKLKYMTLTALATAFIFATTIMIQIPNGIGGYIHLGDGLLLLFASILPPQYAFIAAGLGSSLADLLSGYTIYVLPTFIIKGLMGVTFSTLSKNKAQTILGYLACTFILVLGYFITEWILYQSVSVALVSVVPNIIQIGCGCILATLLNPLIVRLNQMVFK